MYAFYCKSKYLSLVSFGKFKSEMRLQDATLKCSTFLQFSTTAMMSGVKDEIAISSRHSSVIFYGFPCSLILSFTCSIRALGWIIINFLQ